MSGTVGCTAGHVVDVLVLLVELLARHQPGHVLGPVGLRRRLGLRRAGFALQLCDVVEGPL